MIKVWVIVTFAWNGYASAGHEIGPYYSKESCEEARSELISDMKNNWHVGQATSCIWHEEKK